MRNQALQTAAALMDQILHFIQANPEDYHTDMVEISGIDLSITAPFNCASEDRHHFWIEGNEVKMVTQDYSGADLEDRRTIQSTDEIFG